MTGLPIPPTVLKFGGAALADGAGVRRACDLVAQRGGPRPIVVVSAAAGVTELLDRLWSSAAGLGGAPGEDDPHGQGAQSVRIRHRTLLSELQLDAEFLDRHLRELTWVLAAMQGRAAPSPADRDHVLSFGERMSARIVAAALSERGLPATPVDAFDLGLVSDSNHGRARPLPETAARVGRALEAVRGIPVVTGFVAVDASGKLTTLGRNGSDLSAALIAVAVGAREVHLWKSVVGVLTADPSLVPAARPIRRLDYRRAAEFARCGAQVLHPDALEPLRLAGIPARVLCFADPEDEGTLIEDLSGGPGDPEGMDARGIACERDWLELGPCPEHLELPGAMRASGRQFAPWSSDLGRALAALAEPVRVVRGLARIAVLRAEHDPARAAQQLEAAGVELLAQCDEAPSTELVIVREVELERAARVLHADLIETETKPTEDQAASA